jgi:hypothetical protein
VLTTNYIENVGLAAMGLATFLSVKRMTIPRRIEMTDEERLKAILEKTPHALEVLTVVEDIMGDCVNCGIPGGGTSCPYGCEDVKDWNRVIPVWINGKEGVEPVEDRPL